MAEYFLKITGHLLESKRPENFPKEITNNFVFEIKDLKAFWPNATKELVAIVHQGGMLVKKNSTALVEDDGLSEINTRVFVPIHMISHFDFYSLPIVQAPIPKEGETEKSN
jgi:hypothetical protein